MEVFLHFCWVAAPRPAPGSTGSSTTSVSATYKRMLSAEEIAPLATGQ
jgi:hypothetical protein